MKFLKNLFLAVSLALMLASPGSATVPSGTVVLQEQGTGAKTAYSFTFDVNSSSDLKVYKYNRTTKEPGSALTEGSGNDYTVSLNTATVGGTVTFTTAPTTNEDALIVLDPVLEQQTDFQTEGRFNEQDLENELDRSRHIDQAQDVTLKRAIKLPLGTSISDALTDEPVDQGYLKWVSSSSEYQHVTLSTSDPFEGVMTTAGDIVTGGSGGSPSRLGLGSADEVLQVNSGATALEYGKVATANLDADAVTNAKIADDAVQNENILDATVKAEKFNFSTYFGGIPPDLVVTNGSTAATQVDIDFSAGGLFLSDGTSGHYVATGNFTCTITSSGANGLDTGSEANSTWYYVFVIYNPTSDISSCLLSISATSPTLPSGYTFYRRVGAVRNNASSNLYSIIQFGNKVSYEPISTPGSELIVLNTGTATVATNVDVSGLVPPTTQFIRALIRIQSRHSSGANYLIYGNVNGSSNEMILGAVGTDSSAQTGTMAIERTIITNSAQIFTYRWSGTPATTQDLDIYILGYTDNI